MVDFSLDNIEFEEKNTQILGFSFFFEHFKLVPNPTALSANMNIYFVQK